MASEWSCSEAGRFRCLWLSLAVVDGIVYNNTLASSLAMTYPHAQEAFGQTRKVLQRHMKVPERTLYQSDFWILIVVLPSGRVSVLKSSHFIPNQPRTESPQSFICDIIWSISTLPACCMRAGRAETARRTWERRGSLGGRDAARYL